MTQVVESLERTGTQPSAPLAVGRQKPNLWQQRLGETLFSVVIYTVLIAGGIFVLIPFFWVVSTSLKEAYAVFIFPPQWIPNPARWDNYVLAWTSQPFNLFLRNTLITSLIPVIGVLVSASLVAFAFSRLRWHSRNLLFFICLSTMFLPSQVTMIPRFILFKQLGWLNTFMPLVVPPFFGGGPFNIFLLRQFFMTIDEGLEEAAELDGAGTLRIWASIIMPLSRPVLAVVAIFTFMGHWRDFMGPMIYLHRLDLWTLMIGISRFDITEYSAVGRPTLQYQMAVTVATMLPPLTIFFLLQRFFISGVVFTGMKG